MRNRILIAALLLACILCAGFMYRAQTRPQFEYKIEYSPKEKKVNELAAQGWELVAVGSEGYGTILSVFVFKRQVAK